MFMIILWPGVASKCFVCWYFTSSRIICGNSSWKTQVFQIEYIGNLISGLSERTGHAQLIKSCVQQNGRFEFNITGGMY